DGKQPAGRAAKSVMYDADMKIWVEGYRAISKGRYIGEKGYFDVWPEKALRYWGERVPENY
ncbi:MAG: ATP-dependent serine protease, partial [Petrimonas sp.]|nr:ATP-dependent serine protease [Petrimonas sp.]